MNEVLPGVWHWTALHPRIRKQVHSHWLADARVILDPMVPPEGVPALDPGPERVVLSNRHHLRDAARFVEEFASLPILAPEAGMHEFGPSDPLVGAYAVGDEVAAGVTAQPMGAICPDDTVLHVRTGGEGLLAFADAIIVWNGELAFVPDFLMDEPEKVKSETLERIDDLLALDFNHLLFAHGDPVIGRGRAALSGFAASPRSADFGG
ncbi:MAG: hypothetical protein M3375_00900 [Actinomycetota bacterium]|nr:hypothetical protein [Actinomycetota bacterium]